MTKDRVRLQAFKLFKMSASCTLPLPEGEQHSADCITWAEPESPNRARDTLGVHGNNG